MRVLTVRWAAGCAAVGSVALGTGALVLAYMDRHRVHAGLTAWDFSNVFGGVANLAVPVVGFVLASRRPANRVGWLFPVAGLGPGWVGSRTLMGCMPLAGLCVTVQLPATATHTGRLNRPGFDAASGKPKATSSERSGVPVARTP